jgi:hypothetical protein
MSSASPSPLAPEVIADDATWLAQALDAAQGIVRLVAMDRGSYRAASFLDDRLLQVPVNAQVLPWPDVEAAFDGDFRSDARWIFHIGHVGSTLISRLLGELDDVLAVREPRLLRDLALSPLPVRAGYLAAVPKLMSRAFAADEYACVKATSFASEIAPDLVPPGERALFMYAAPPNYIGSILAGPNSIEEQKMMEGSRRARLEARGIALPPSRTDADRAALTWACEMTALEAAADAMPDRSIEWIDFDRALAALPAALAHAADLFGFDHSPDQLAAIASGPLTRQYSKATEYDYSAELRRELIEEATHHHREAIRAALAMLERAAQESPLLARALSRSTEA